MIKVKAHIRNGARVISHYRKNKVSYKNRGYTKTLIPIKSLDYAKFKEEKDKTIIKRMVVTLGKKQLPIISVLKKGNRYFVLNGHHRVGAYKESNKSHIKAWVK